MNKTKGYYFGKYSVSLGKYSGPDFSKRCFIFPGQGAAFPGMFKDEYFKFKIFREKFALADSLAQKLNLQKVSDYILNPDKLKKETFPIVANLALFTIESALFEILISQNKIPKILTGHSFGEYAVLVASGTASFEEIFDVVYHRDYFCPPANSTGFMIAAGTDAKKIKTILGKEKYFISNFNSPRQTVFSVAKNNVDVIAKILEDKKIRYKILYNIPQPYHSPYLNGVKSKIKQYLKNKKIHFKKPETPLFSSVLKKKIDKKNFRKEDIENILLNQIITPVDFISQVKFIYGLKCSNFLELGSKKLFSIFVEDILIGKEIKTELALDFLQKTKTEERTVETDNLKENKAFSLINKVIGKITGYEIEKISIEDKFQEDLGIDSIKKADILLTVLNEANISPGEDFNTSEFTTIKDAVSYLEKIKNNPVFKNVSLAKKTNFRRYVFSPVKKQLKNYPWNNLDYDKNDYFILNIADIFKNKSNLAKKAALFVGKKFSKAGKRPSIIIRAYSGCFDIDKMIFIFRFFREFVNLTRMDDFNLILFSSGGSLNQPVDYYIQCLVSFLKSLKRESPELFFKNIHFDAVNDEKATINIVIEEANEFLDIDVFYKAGERFVFKPKIIESKKQKQFNLNEKSVILAIAGAKGATFSLIKNISQKYRPIIYLVGRSAGGNKIISANIAELKKQNQKIHYKSLDACDADAMGKLFLEIIKKHKKIDLAINGAGVVKNGLLKDKTDYDMNYEFNNKIFPALNILNLSLKYKIKRVINFSSIISKYGNAGQTVYASANAFVNGITENYNLLLEKIGSSATAINFPPWDKIGMTEDKIVFQKLKEFGVSFLGREKADELFLFDLFFPSGKPVYYLDSFDDLFYGFSLNNLKRYRPIIGDLIDNSNISASKIVFNKDFDLSKDVYLKDHKIKGLSFAPAAIGIAMFICFGNVYFKKTPIFKNIIIQNPIMIKDKVAKCFLKIERKNRFFSFSVESNIPHFYGETENDEFQKAPRFNLMETGKEVAKKSIYSDFYLKNNLYFGPVFQSIDRAQIDKNGNYSFIIDNFKLPPVFGFEPYDKLIQWIDALFQSLGVIALKKKVKMLPIKISKFSFFSETEISDFVYAVPLKIKFNKDGLKGSIALTNKNGECIIELKDVFFKKYE